MRLFISYARIDKPYCSQIIDLLDMHETWYDHRLHAGQKWWEEILRRLSWCQGLVFLISPESVGSEYCRRELAIAHSLGKCIFPTLIHARTEIPDMLRHVQYADLSNGLDAKAIKELLTAIFIAERQLPVAELGFDLSTTIPLKAVSLPPAGGLKEATLIDEAAGAMDDGNFDRAVFLLKSAKEAGFSSRFIDLAQLLGEAESALERQAYLREAAREYASIVALVRRERTRKIGCDAYVAFQKDFPDYDPEDLTSYCQTLLISGAGHHHATPQLPLNEWCFVPTGSVTLEQNHKTKVLSVPAFSISKYPVTNSQFQAFIDAEDGYRSEVWWDNPLGGLDWHRANAAPHSPRYEGRLYPRSNVSWHEAAAYCKWLSTRSGLTVTLPTEQQWQRAAQGDDGRLYPWGNTFDKTLCNSIESELRTITQVTQYPQGASPYGVCDMAGNVWEWCSNITRGATAKGGEAKLPQVTIRGGSCISPHERCVNTFRFLIDPRCRYFSIGFRPVCEALF